LCRRFNYSMKKYLLRLFRLFRHYYLSRSKYDIHSPFVYKLYSEVLKDKADYAEYHSSIYGTVEGNILLSGKDCRLLFRLSRYFKPKTMLIFGTNETAGLSSLVSGFPGSDITYVYESQSQIDDSSVFDMVLFSCDLHECVLKDYFSRIIQHIHNDSVLIFCNMHGSKEMHEMWNEIKSHPSVTLTIDLFNLGLIFSKEELTKEEFILRY
jgi:hypothetical protein